MQSLLKTTIYLFLAIFAATAVVTISGLASVWFWNRPASVLPYLGTLLGALILEVVGVVIVVGKRGIMYLPDVKKNRTSAETDSFMDEFIAHGSSVTIVSNRLAWLIDAHKVQDTIVRRARSGTQFEIITSRPIASAIRARLAAAGVRFLVTGEEHIPEARFTLINAERSGAERLAIAKGTHPDHEITIFDSNSGPQIIGLAKDIVRRSKTIANATPVE